MILTIEIWLLGIYLAICMLIGYFNFRKETSKGFLIADRKVRTIPLATTLTAGYVGGGLLVTFTALAFIYGISAIWLFVGISLGLFIFASFFSKKLKNLADEHEFYTLSDYFYYKFGKKTGFITTILIFIAYTALLFIQFIAGGKLLSSISGWSYTASVSIMGTIILIYLFLGGFKSVIKTDFFQFLIMFILIFILVFSFNTTIKINPEQYNLLTIGIGQILAFTLLGILAVLTSADTWQRIYAAKNIKTAKKGFYSAGIVLIIFGLTVALIGITTKNNFPLIASEDALFYGLNFLLSGPIKALGFIFIFASLMSTADTCAFIMAMNFSRDTISRLTYIPRRKLVSITRIIMLIMIPLSILLAILIQDIVGVFFAVISLLLALAPVMISSFIWNINEKAAFYSILSGFLATTILLLFGYITPETSLVSLPAALIILIVGQIFYKIKNKGVDKLKSEKIRNL